MAYQRVCVCSILFFIAGHSFSHHQHHGKYNDNHDYWDWVPPLQKNPYQYPNFSKLVYPSKDFSYSNNGGSKNWPSSFSECGGKHQSPINIQTRKVHSSFWMPTLTLNNYWDNVNLVIINNSGKRVDIMLEGNLRMPTIQGGPLTDIYEFVDLHFHWGQNDNEGSEHTINSQTYPMEAHLVHFKKTYGNVKDATKHLDGIAVVAFLFEIDTEEIKDFSELVADLRLIEKANSAVNMSSASASFHWIKNLIKGPYFTYAGSLTTPPCSEVVTWIIYQRPTKISRRQMEVFRKLESSDGHKITNNHRNPQRYAQPHVVTGSSQPESTVHLFRFPPERPLKPPHHLSSFSSHHADFLPNWFTGH